MGKEPILIFEIETHEDIRRGNVSVIENAPFPVKRVFFVYNVPVGEMRGGHAHRTCKQLLVAICGAVRVLSGDGKQYILDCPEYGLYIPPMHLIHMEFLVENTVLLVLASKKYDPKDYLYGAE